MKPAPCEACYAMERTARIVSRLRHVLTLVHQERGHRTPTWRTCPLDPCQATRQLIEADDKEPTK